MMISGFILAGGKSSRLGTDKALLTLNDQTLLQRIISIVDPFCLKVYVSGQKHEYTSASVELVPDMVSDCGPIAGLLSSLSTSTTDWNLIVSVDVPLINEDLIAHLIANANDCDCVIPIHNDRIEPLIAMYHRSALPIIQELISSKQYKLQHLVSKLNTNYLNCNELIGRYPKLFHNVNRMEDFHSISIKDLNH